MGTARSTEPTVTRRLDADARLKVQALLDKAALVDGFAALSDQLVADLGAPGPDDESAPVSVLLPDAASDGLAGYGQASPRDDRWTMQIVVDPTRRGAGTGAEHTLLEATVEAVDHAGGGPIDWWVYAPGPGADGIASAHGFRPDRDLLQMRRTLPADRPSAVTTRSFVVGADDTAWLSVNNRAFAGHAEQGGWTIDTLHQRLAQPWFDPDGFRLHEREGRLAAFCWTKIHDDGDGEIYVIGVDPDFQGLGLGRELTLAGLDHLTAAGAQRAMLYVAGENAGARSLYERLGFVVHRADRAYQRRPERPGRPGQPDSSRL